MSISLGGSRSTPGPGCSKLTMPLVNEALTFQTFSQICQYFLLKKCEKLKASLIFSTKNFSVFGYKLIIHLTSWPLKKLVKLTMLWTTGPWTLKFYNMHTFLTSSSAAVSWVLHWCVLIRGGNYLPNSIHSLFFFFFFSNFLDSTTLKCA